MQYIFNNACLTEWINYTTWSMKQCIWELWKSKCSVQMYLKVIAICVFIFCLWCLILINRSATFVTVDLYLLETLSFPVSRETPFSPVFLPTSMVSPSQLPMLAFPPLLTWTWAPFSSLSALIYGIKHHLCARYFHINILGPDISLERQTHTSSCLFDISTSPHGCFVVYILLCIFFPAQYRNHRNLLSGNSHHISPVRDRFSSEKSTKPGSICFPSISELAPCPGSVS